jgi:hypothetical protein
LVVGTVNRLGLAPDGSGGAVVVGAPVCPPFPCVTQDVYANHIDASGGKWAVNGIVVCNATGVQQYPSVAADGAGGSYLVWNDWRTSANQLYAQKLNASGVPQWQANGVLVCSQDVVSNPLRIIADGSGGAIMCWEDWRANEKDLYAQRMSAAGTPLWTVDGVAVCNLSGPQNTSTLVSDGTGGAIIAWQDGRGLVAQRLDANGTALWAANGVVVSGGAYDHLKPEMVADGGGGAFVVWEDYRNGGDIYGQHIDGSGTSLWAADGLPICTAANLQLNPRISPDGQGGILVGWGDQRTAGSTKAFLQRLTSAGAALWPPDGIRPGPYLGDALVAPDGSGGAYLLSGGSVLMRVLATGDPAWVPNYRPVVTVEDEPSDQGGYVQVHFGKPVSDGGFVPAYTATTGYFIWRKVPGTSALGSARLVDGAGMDRSAIPASDTPWLDFPPGTWVAASYFPATQSATYTFLAPTHDDSTAAGSADDAFIVMGYSTPTLQVLSAEVSGHSVDNLAPGPPQSLAGGQTGQTSVRLTWTANAESDLWHYAVYRGDSPDFVPSATNRIGQPTAATWDDDGFEPGVSYYKVSTVDRHGNESGYAMLSPTDFTSVPPGQLPRITYLGSPAPNPLQGEAVIEYGLASPARVSLAIFDVDGRRIARLVEGPQAAGVRRARWSGRDERGHALAPGIYVVRLTIDNGSYTRKLAKMD